MTNKQTTHTPPPGYKRTPLGWIPEEWEVVNIRSIAKLIQTGPFGSQIKANEYVNGGVPLINPSHIREDRISPDFAISVTSDKAKELKKHQFKLGDIVLARRGELGRCAIITSKEINWLCGTGSLLIRLNSEVILSEIVAIWMRSKRIVNQLRMESMGSTMNNLNASIVSGILLPLPPLPEQRRIAAILATWDRAIELTQQLLAAKTQQKRALMQQLLTGRVRLPGCRGQWQESNLGSILNKIIGGGTPSKRKPNYWNGNIPWASVKDITKFNPNGTQEYITEIGLKNSSSNLIPAGTIIVSTRMALGKAVIFKRDVAINQDLKALFHNDEKVILEFLKFWFELKETNIEKLGSGSTVSGITLQALKKLKILLLPIPEQTAIARILTTADAELALLERRLAALQAQKRGLMQVLLTGKIRVKL
ncbi:MAG TPA: restriction endonuclease subunit S [Saprospiraceae bacterium]|nr:restriction endonuclease subunit S [Saprospiraceae bacterium]HMP25515.1 restriction endonuclease subunit S [Saprospiraceae bacterium]